jgi:hypothetical protein
MPKIATPASADKEPNTPSTTVATAIARATPFNATLMIIRDCSILQDFLCLFFPYDLPGFGLLYLTFYGGQKT